MSTITYIFVEVQEKYLSGLTSYLELYVKMIW